MPVAMGMEDSFPWGVAVSSFMSSSMVVCSTLLFVVFLGRDWRFLQGDVGQLSVAGFVLLLQRSALFLPFDTWLGCLPFLRLMFVGLALVDVCYPLAHGGVQGFAENPTQFASQQC